MILNDQQHQLIAQSISYHRKRIAAKSPMYFAKVYMDHHCGLPFSRMHLELFEMLGTATRKRDQKIAVAAPRGHAKSTVVSLAYVLWSILYDHDKYVYQSSMTLSGCLCTRPVVLRLQKVDSAVKRIPVGYNIGFCNS